VHGSDRIWLEWSLRRLVKSLLAQPAQEKKPKVVAFSTVLPCQTRSNAIEKAIEVGSLIARRWAELCFASSFNLITKLARNKLVLGVISGMKTINSKQRNRDMLIPNQDISTDLDFVESVCGYHSRGAAQPQPDGRNHREYSELWMTR
jgi:hypothetical protein